MAPRREAGRRLDHRHVRIHRSYTVAEAAERLGVHRNTVRNYLKRGLPSMKTSAGVLILGAALRAFLANRKAAAKSPCPPGFMYCLRCRAPRRPPTGLVELIWVEGGAPNLRGLCPECETLMHRRVGRGGLEAAGFALPSEARAPTPNR